MSTELHASTDFPGGNACFLDLRTTGETPEIHFTPSPAGGPEAMWFYFRVRAAQSPPPANIKCVLHFVENLLGGRADALLPVYKTAAAGWRRVRGTDVEEMPDGQPLVSWNVPGDRGEVSIALCYPYGQAEAESLLRRDGGSFRMDGIGATPSGRLLPRFSNGPGAPGSSRPGIYCTARQHAGEVPGSWILDGFLRGMDDAGAAAPLIWAAPFVDLDGVTEGRYGKDSFPYDFNRAWGATIFPQSAARQKGISPMRYEIKCIQSDMMRFGRRCRPVLHLDFHAPTLQESDGIYIFARKFQEGGKLDPAHAPWVEAFRLALESQKIASQKHFVLLGEYLSRWNTARVGDFVLAGLNIPSLSLETPYNRAAGRVLSVEDYIAAGAALSRAAIEVADRICTNPYDHI